MSIQELQCNNCMINRASFYKIVEMTLPNCRCTSIIKPRIHRSVYRNNFQVNNLSYIKYSPENCKCNRREEYTDFITRTLRNNIPILEFKGKIPEIPKDNNITWHFLGCTDCVNDRPWVRNYMAKVFIYNDSSRDTHEHTVRAEEDHDSLVD